MEPGHTVEGQLAGGQSKDYEFTLREGQYLFAVVEPRGIDLVAEVRDPKGEVLLEAFSPNEFQLPELVQMVASRTGAYQLSVHPFRPVAGSGKYQIRVIQVRAASAADKSQAAAARLFAEGQKLLKQGDKELSRKAVSYLRDSLPLWRAAGDKQGEASTLHSLGVVQSNLSDHKQAIDLFQQAVTRAKECGDKIELAVTLMDLGEELEYVGENQKALDSLQESASVSKAIGHAGIHSHAVNDLGLVYRKQGENRKAIEYYQQALEIRRSADDAYGQAQSLSNLAVVYDLLGEHQKALDYLETALPLTRSIADPNAEGYVLNNIGIVYSSLGDLETAVDYYLQALELRRKSHQRAGEVRNLVTLCAAYERLGQWQKALRYAQEANSLGEAIHDRQGLGRANHCLGVVYQRMGQTQKALQYHHQALELARVMGDPSDEVIATWSIGESLLELGDLQGALDMYQRTLSIGHALGVQEYEVMALSGIAQIESARDELASARARVESAIKIIESVRRELKSSELRASYFASVKKHYSLYIDILMQLHKSNPGGGFDAEALAVSERGRARVLLDTLAEARADIRQGVDPTLLWRERELLQRLGDKTERQIQLSSDPANARQAVAMAKEIELLYKDYEEVLAAIRSKSPRYAALTQPAPLSLAQIQAGLEDDTLLLEYALGENHSYLWAVSPSGLSSFELPPRAKIETIARRLYEQIEARLSLASGLTQGSSGEIRQAEARFQKYAAALSQLVLAPVADQLGRRRLVIVPAGALHFVPFAALPDPASSRKKGASGSVEPLVAQHQIVNLSSFSALAVLRQERARRSAEQTLAVLADPVFDAGDERVKSAVRPKELGSRVSRRSKEQSLPLRAFRAGGAVVRLPFSRREAERIAALAAHPMLALDFAANRTTALGEALAHYHIVHFATHGLLNTEYPQLSGILLSTVDERGAPQNGFVGLSDIYNLNWSADLVVLSACQTGLGKEIKGEGLVGLTRGFMYAGSPRVVASLWKIDDVATPELMERFYRGMLREALSPAEALQRAQVEMWKQPRWHSPFYWAAFAIHGEWRG